MTCIVGIAENGRVWMGCDSAIENGNAVRSMAAKKVVEFDDFLIGVSGDARLLQLVSLAFVPPKRGRGETASHYMALTFTKALHACVTKHGHRYKITGEGLDASDAIGGSALVAYCGKLFEIGCDMLAIERAENYTAIGCGRFEALGSLHTTAKDGKRPVFRIQRALSASAQFNASVRAPFAVLKKEWS